MNRRLKYVAWILIKLAFNVAVMVACFDLAYEMIGSHHTIAQVIGALLVMFGCIVVWEVTGSIWSNIKYWDTYGDKRGTKNEGLSDRERT